MTIKTSYICDKCGKVYDNYDDVYACENSHFEPEGYNEVTWKSLRYEKGEKFPASLIIRLEKADDYGYKAYALYRIVKGFTDDEARDLEEKAKAKEGEDE